jgi:Secretion system C-terminal sorting domain
MKTLKYILLVSTVLFIQETSFGQNQNLSEPVNKFNGEPNLSINPNNPQHMVVAWMGMNNYNISKVVIKTRVSFNSGITWNTANYIPHTNPIFTSADPVVNFDNSGNVYLTYIDWDVAIDSGAVYVVKSTDGGLNWGIPAEVINVHSDPGNAPIDRPWTSVDCSGGLYNGNIYVTTILSSQYGANANPNRVYFIVSDNGGISFNSWKYLNQVSNPPVKPFMPTHCVSSNGIFHAIYQEVSMNPLKKVFVIASSNDAGSTFTYNIVYSSSTVLNSAEAKKGYLLISDPSDANHLAFIFLDNIYGDIDIFLVESFDEGVSWSSPKRINDDPIGNKRMQDLLWADFDFDGDLIVSWRDRRNSEDSTYTTSSEIWGAYRYKNSTEFSANFPISDESAPYDPIVAEAGNDFMCIKLVDDTLNAVWGDVRTEKMNIWFQRMSPNGNILSNRQISSEKIPEVKIIPNPAISNVRIEGENIKNVIIVDVNGKILHAQKNLNRIDKLDLNLENFEKGIYFVQVTTTTGKITKKIVIK